jgi:hypothetical protein
LSTSIRCGIAALGVFLLSSLSSPAGAGETASHTLALSAGTVSPPATISDVAWIAGSWTCEALGGTAQEYWQAPNAGAMLGSFRMIRDGRPSFYEIATISEKDGSLVCRILHFDENLVGWEKERDGGPQTFPLVKLEGRTAYFDGLTFQKKDDGSLDVWVVIHGKDGSSKEALFAYQPMAASASTPRTTSP